MCGEAATVSRLAGDEFAVVYRSPFHPKGGREVAAAITEVMGNPINYHQQQFPLICSIGIARFPQDTRNSADLQRFADFALYRSKAAGCSMWTAFDETMAAEFLSRHGLEAICGAQSPTVASNPGISQSYRARPARLLGSRPWRDGNIPSDGCCFRGFLSQLPSKAR